MELDVSKIIKIEGGLTELPVKNHSFSTERCTCPTPENLAILTLVITPVYDGNIFDPGYEKITSLDLLKKELTEVLVRFDTNPRNLTKSDFAQLNKVLYQSLLFTYEWIENYKEPTISINNKEVESTDHNSNIEIQSDEYITVETLPTSDNKTTGIKIKANVGEMDKPSAKLATINDIRNYISNKLSWKTYD